MLAQRAAASAGRIYEILDTDAGDRRPARRRRPGRATRRGGAARRHLPLRRGRAGARAPRPAPGTGRDGGAHRPHRQRQVDDRPAAPALLRRIRGRGARRRPRRARPHGAQPALGHRAGARRAVPVLRERARQHRLRASRRVRRRRAGGGSRRGRRGVHRRAARGVRQRGGGARLHAVGWSAPAGRDRAHAARRPRHPHPRRRHQRHRRAGRGGDPRRPPRAHGGSDDARHRPPAVDDQPGRAGRAARRRSDRRRRDPCRSHGHGAPVRRGAGAHRGGRRLPTGTSRGGRQASGPARRAGRNRRRPSPGQRDWEISSDGLGRRRWPRRRRSAAGAAAARSGLPFAGVPPELQSRVDKLLEHEPDHEHESVTYEPVMQEAAPFSLRQLLVPHRLALAGSVALVALETVALQAGPLLTQIAIDDGIRAGKREVVFIGRRAVPRQRVRGRRHQSHPDRVDRPGGRAAALRPAGEGVQPLPAALHRLLLAREGRSPHDPDDERSRQPHAAPAGGVGPAVRAGPDDGVRDGGAVLDAARPRRHHPARDRAVHVGRHALVPRVLRHGLRHACATGSPT